MFVELNRFIDSVTLFELEPKFICPERDFEPESSCRSFLNGVPGYARVTSCWSPVCAIGIELLSMPCRTELAIGIEGMGARNFGKPVVAGWY